VKSALGVGAVIAAVFVTGWMLPVAHSASRTLVLEAPPDKVFAIVSDASRYPEWNTAVERVETSGDPGPGQRVRLFGSYGEIPYTVEVLDPPSRMVTRIDSGLAFGGAWTYDLRPDGTGTRITITEDGEVYNAFFRFMAQYVFGHYATIDQYLADLTRVVQ
jgi:uncharacterized protein YndB with AHSA1/START domain